METTNFLEKYPSLEKMKSFISSCEGSIKTSRDAINYRMGNYYNCIDDYSSGGLCDKAANENIADHQRYIRLIEEQIKLDGKTFVEEFIQHVLVDSTGKIVSDKLIYGRFGPCWIIPGGEGSGVSFVSESKKMSTYNKKGYGLAEIKTKVEYYYLPRACKNGLFSVGRVLEETKVVLTELPQHTDTHQNSLVYWAKQNNLTNV